MIVGALEWYPRAGCSVKPEPVSFSAPVLAADPGRRGRRKVLLRQYVFYWASRL